MAGPTDTAFLSSSGRQPHGTGRGGRGALLISAPSPSLYSLHSGSTDQTPTMQSYSMEPGSSPSFSVRLVPSCVQGALGDSKLSKTVSCLEEHSRTVPGLQSAPAAALPQGSPFPTVRSEEAKLFPNGAEPPTSFQGMLPSSFSLKHVTLNEVTSHQIITPSTKITGFWGPADGLFWCPTARVNQKEQ